MKNWINKFAIKIANATNTPSAPISQITRGSELFSIFSGSNTGGTVAVNERVAMCVSAVIGCVNLIGGAISSMPLHFYERTDSGRQRYSPDIWWLLNERAFNNWPASALWVYVVLSKLLHGDAFVQIHRASRFSSVITGFEPIHPLNVDVKKINGRLSYTLWKNADDGSVYVEVVDQDDMLHVSGPGFNGLRGISQIKHGLQNAAGIAYAADQFAGQFFNNGARPDFAIEMPGNPTVEQQEMMRSSWNERYQGFGNSHKPALLAGGVKIHEITMNAEDSQLLATRSFQVEEICRIFGVPPHMIGHTEKATSWGTGIEQMSIGFVKFTLQPHLVAFEQEINSKVFRTPKNFCEFQTAGLERGDIKARYEGYRIAIGRAGEPGWMTVNEVRNLENQLPRDGGDSLYQPNQTPNSSSA